MEQGLLTNNQQITRSREYRPEIDGLRALAVLGVVVYHYYSAWLPGGFVGVDVFFVISGFLITRLIERDLQESLFSFKVFYERRIRRIFPAFFVMVATVLTVEWWLAIPFNYFKLSQETKAAILSYANFYFAKNTNYFDVAADTRLLIHTWSLSVEEQFYLVLPLLLVLIYWFAPSKPRIRAAVLALFWIASFSACVWFSKIDLTDAFYLPYFRAWELLTGSLVAFVPSIRWNKLASTATSFVGLGMILVPMVLFNSKTTFPGVVALLPVLGTALALFSTSEEANPIHHLLALPPFRAIGLISYSLYLWHWPIYLIARTWLIYSLVIWQIGLIFAASVLVATLSWLFIENPVRQKKIFRSQLSAYALLIVAGALLVGTVIFIGSNNGFPQRYQDDPIISQLKPDAGWDYKNCTIYPNQSTAEDTSITYCHFPRKFRIDGIANTVIFGDSHARALFPAFEKIAEQNKIKILAVGVPGCRPYGGPSNIASKEICDKVTDNIVNAILKNSRIKNVVLHGYFMVDINDDFEGDISELITKLVKGGKQVYVLGSVPAFSYNDLPESIFMAHQRGFPLSSLAEHNAKRLFGVADHELSVIDALPSDVRSKVKYVELMSIFCDEVFCKPATEKEVYYRDYHHLSSAGAEITVDRIQEQVFGIKK